ncbi:MAG: MBL fold metallo-hydrolase [Gemmatimonadota bacterium]|nr:MBL fold metallo-hydrolase [Gemmatimonadota bacterium]
MSKRSLAAWTLALSVPALALTACATSEETPAPDDAAGGSGEEAAVGAAPVRTGNPYERGLTDADFPRVQELADGVYSYEQIHVAGGETITTVSLFVVTPAGVLVADGQESVEETRRLIDTIAGITDQPITHMVISSDHGDHSAGNSVFPADAEFYAHPTSAATLERQASSPNRSADDPPVVLPTRLVEEREILDVGGREIHLVHLGRAHTGGDLLVYVPDGKVLFMSETFLNRIFPAMRSAYPSEWVAMVETAQAMDVDVYVPGHGLVEDPELLEEELERYRQAMVSVIAEATRLHEAGLDADEAVEEADFGDVGGWTLNESQGPIAVRRVYLELNGELPG